MEAEHPTPNTRRRFSNIIHHPSLILVCGTYLVQSTVGLSYERKGIPANLGDHIVVDAEAKYGGGLDNDSDGLGPGKTQLPLEPPAWG